MFRCDWTAAVFQVLDEERRCNIEKTRGAEHRLVKQRRLNQKQTEKEKARHKRGNRFVRLIDGYIVEWADRLAINRFACRFRLFTRGLKLINEDYKLNNTMYLLFSQRTPWTGRRYAEAGWRAARRAWTRYCAFAICVIYVTSLSDLPSYFTFLLLYGVYRLWCLTMCEVCVGLQYFVCSSWEQLRQ